MYVDGQVKKGGGGGQCFKKLENCFGLNWLGFPEGWNVNIMTQTSVQTWE